MSRLKDYKAALEAIAGDKTLTIEDARGLAARTLNNGADEDHARMIESIGKMVISKGLIFATAEEIADAAAAIGLKTPRGKEWSRVSISRYMNDIRGYISGVVSGAAVSVAPAAPAAPVAEDEPEAVENDTDQLLDGLDELDELEELVRLN